MSRLSPGDPLESYYGNAIERMSIEHKEKAMNRLGLNEPIYVQYGKWLKNSISGDFGINNFNRKCNFLHTFFLDFINAYINIWSKFSYITY